MADTTTIIRDKAMSAPIGRFQYLTSLPSTPEAYYGGSSSLQNDEWRGGETVFIKGTSTGSKKLYVQTATSGRTATWKRLLPAFT